jgi:hypothetical protein
MTRRAPAFPPDVAAALQRPSGSVAVTYTRPRSLSGAPRIDLVLMTTSYERLLASLVLDTKLDLRFIRTGSPAEGARVALASAVKLIETGSRHWRITLDWTPDEIAVHVDSG